MLDRLLRPRIEKTRKSVLLLGPRQVGKSTLTRSLGPDRIIDLSDEAAYLSFAKDPGLLGREVRALRRPSLILIEEIQRLPSLLNTVQALIDEARGHRFLLTGSSARKLKRGGANLLPGRILFEQLDPLSFWELGEALELERALSVGGLPGVYLDRESGVDVLDSYTTVYLREEIQAEALLRDVGSYARFLDVAAAASGQWINYSKLASDTEIPKETVRRYFQILEDTLLAFRIPPFSPRGARRRVSQRDRFLLFDLGVRNALLGAHRSRPSPTELGPLFEHWLILQVLFYARARRLPWRVSAYRTDGGAEVDLILDTGKVLVAIECKFGRAATAAPLGGIRSFMAMAGARTLGIVVFGGDQRQRLDERIEAVPYRDFLSESLPELAERTT
jgi:predicted AAA+ superfamily ATPase